MKSLLAMEAPGASAEQVWRALAAAEAVFTRHRTTAQEVAEALFTREQDELAGAFVPADEWQEGAPPPQRSTVRQMEIADVWFEADAAAVSACYAGCANRPKSAQLVLHYPTSAASGPH